MERGDKYSIQEYFDAVSQIKIVIPNSNPSMFWVFDGYQYRSSGKYVGYDGIVEFTKAVFKDKADEVIKTFKEAYIQIKKVSADEKSVFIKGELVTQVDGKKAVLELRHILYRPLPKYHCYCSQHSYIEFGLEEGIDVEDYLNKLCDFLYENEEVLAPLFVLSDKPCAIDEIEGVEDNKIKLVLDTTVHFEVEYWGCAGDYNNPPEGPEYYITEADGFPDNTGDWSAEKAEAKEKCLKNLKEHGFDKIIRIVDFGGQTYDDMVWEEHMDRGYGIYDENGKDIYDRGD